jgi:hypothetical protein
VTYKWSHQWGFGFKDHWVISMDNFLYLKNLVISKPWRLAEVLKGVGSGHLY